MPETGVQPLGQENPQEKETATHSSIQAWRIPWTEEPGGPQCLRSQSWTQPSMYPQSEFTSEANKRHVGIL